MDGGQHECRQHIGLKEGFPLCTLLLCMVYESFYGRKSGLSPVVVSYSSIDDVAFVPPNRATSMKMLPRVTEVGDVLGIHEIKPKTEIYQWEAAYRHNSFVSKGQVMTMKLPILNYRGHTVAHP